MLNAEGAASVEGLLTLPGTHFSILEELAQPNGAILEALQEMA